MALNLTEIFETYRTTHLAEAMGLPITTVHGWKQANAIPGKGILREMRVQALKTAIKSLKNKKRKVAA
jgi:hypothetical protein